jgi:hypothetical protein
MRDIENNFVAYVLNGNSIRKVNVKFYRIGRKEMGFENGSPKLFGGILFFLSIIFMHICTSEASWINEIHYDNSGTDTGEAIELAIATGTDLSGWSIVLYSGADGLQYSTTYLSGVVSEQGFGGSLLVVPISPIQNGSPDGIALINSANNVLQFLSYEGMFTAIDGPAAGITSEDIGVFEDFSTPVDWSLQLVGVGSKYNDFTWSTPTLNTFGFQNLGITDADPLGNTLPLHQVINGITSEEPPPIPEPSTFLLLGGGLVGLTFYARRRRKE